MRHQVEDRRGPGADAERREHVAELAERRVGQYALDVGLGHGDRRREDRGEDADAGDDHERRWGVGEDRIGPRHQVDAGVDHRRGVDQRGDRGRALHRIREPDMERELGALAHRPGEDQQRDEHDRSLAELADALEDLADVERAEADEDQHDPEREAHVADAVDDECLLGGERRGALAVPEADEQVAAQPDQLPGHEHDQEVAGQHQQQHREHEQVQVGEEPPVPRVVAHVPDRVDVHEQADRGHDDKQARRQRVDHEPDVDHECPGRDPGEHVHDVPVRVLRARQQRSRTAEDVVHESHRQDPHDEDRPDRDPAGPLPEAPPDERRHREPRQRQDHQPRDEAFEIHLELPCAPSDEPTARRAVRLTFIDALRRIRRRAGSACCGRWRSRWRDRRSPRRPRPR